MSTAASAATAAVRDPDARRPGSPRGNRAAYGVPLG